jgi:hypothetical protein
VLTQD